MTEIEIDDVHEFMLEKLAVDDADHSDVVESLIYRAHQAQKQQDQVQMDEAEDVAE